MKPFLKSQVKPKQTKEKKVCDGSLQQSLRPLVPGFDFNACDCHFSHDGAGHTHLGVPFGKAVKYRTGNQLTEGVAVAFEKKVSAAQPPFLASVHSLPHVCGFLPQRSRSVLERKEKRIKAVRNSPANIDLSELRKEGSTWKNLNGKAENTVDCDVQDRLRNLLLYSLGWAEFYA